MEFAAFRADMVDSLQHDTKAAVDAAATARAMREVPRHEFVDEDRRAYTDQSLEHRGTRVLAPSTVGRLVDALAPEDGDDVLVVGAGVGYTAAVLAEIVGPERVHAVDIDRRVVYDARANLADAGYGDVLVDCRDGARGFPEYAPFDRVLVEAAAVDPPAALLDQLADGGRLVYPEGATDQRLVAIEDRETASVHGPVAFAPLLVDGEQASAVERNRTVREDRERAAQEAQSRTGWEQDWIDWD
ncbi:protein-L-isoaspartate O-methyltransferase family protein [Halobacterium hubeiense]|uniref:protein-L-isoaspartate O-methyltransferase family protein n=1 Tax=Halobacterium hubeiense TaxID=1407499 RepID=UPI003C737F7D